MCIYVTDFLMYTGVVPYDTLVISVILKISITLHPSWISISISNSISISFLVF